MGWSVNRPTGLTYHRRGLSTKGYTLLTPHGDTASYLIDIDGCVVHRWIFSHIKPGYGRLLDNGNLLMTGSDIDMPKPPKDEPTKPPPPLDRHVTRLGGYHTTLAEVDWDGNVVWKFRHYERIQDGRRKARWMARQHHDYQREGNPVGYYAPGMEPLLAGGNTLILCHKNVSHKGISEKPILDDTFIEVSWEGKVIWEWLCSDHFDELGFDEFAVNDIVSDFPFISVSFPPSE